MKKLAEAERKFLIVRNALNNREDARSYRLSYKKPYNFYFDHTIEESIKILRAEAKNN